MKILHINSNYLYTSIYENLLDNLDHDIENIIFNPVKKKNIEKINSKYEIFKPNNIKKADSLFTLSRMRRNLYYIKNQIDFTQSDLLIHAHSMTNDGLLAYKLYKKYKLPYVLTVRNTDVNFTLKYKKHLFKIYEKVLLNAEVIIFPNHSYKNKMIEIFKSNEKLIFKMKNSRIIPNGVDRFWHENYSEQYRKLNLKKEINVLFVGRIYKQKNLHRVVSAINQLNEQKYNVNYNVVGSVIDKKYFEKLNKSKDFNYLGEKSKIEILDIMKDNDMFIMPSENETFGLVYIEAISQNLPIIFTKNEGIDDYFPENKYGEAVNAFEVNSIKNGILKIIKDYEKYQKNMISKNHLEDFKWEKIGFTYSLLYKGILEK